MVLALGQIHKAPSVICGFKSVPELLARFTSALI